ncbi:thymidylate kinase with Fltmp and Appnhp [Rhizopus microsporus var. microsporus]|uniref:Thymidylate kinase n=2 Tax=Rhizopus microsporus TaxID=58291 RepID=A0A2G4SJV5_RHIZD|nr:thymidylate kinase with Fltmp and Appnhp [Rhizopus microsporus ATCC 52813]ORE01091.1 thymidylate kinase with Fltmp and Appnhp [Rhizopus microsporus var. microsporus]PHZ09041.1 thymidylate kinase with Fltmp and Appnhp [Rhizopus microsporus ATCC 52813]
MTRGLMIVVEGCDRSGKSTQCELLVHNLKSRNIDSELVKFPDRTTQTGKMIDSYLRQKSDLDDHAIHLLFSANRWEAMKSISEKLLAGKTLVIDRYAYSGVAFSVAKGLDFDWCKHPDVGLLSPDLVLFLDLSINEAEKRGGFGEERYEKRDLQIKVRTEFRKLKDDSWKFIDASSSMEKVEQDVMKIVLDEISKPRKELQYNLWKH